LSKILLSKYHFSSFIPSKEPTKVVTDFGKLSYT